MEQIERDLLTLIQREFPIDRHPFAELGKQLGITEGECISMLEKLTNDGVLREIRPVMNWKEAGFTALLIGIVVDEEKIDTVAEALNEIPGVTHNYRREGKRNLWCTLTCEPDEVERYVTFMSLLDGVSDVKQFASENTYKIGLVLDV